ncbi:MAG: LytTR family transcriptional regulator [Prevotella sp.]|jgi:DNA-binding LytR/AlgR family response regulator|nr:LytTR family transcriptional regulator [Prevotella sp.]MBR6190104.1 LytTR family transcriptional regulator [Prevotella sp.]
MDNRLCLVAHDEMFIIDLQKVLYFEADDHYAHVYYASGTHFMVPYGLAKIETALAQKGSEAEALQRMGRKYIVNTNRIFRVNTITENVSLADDQGGNIFLHIPKTVLRALLDSIMQT